VPYVGVDSENGGDVDLYYEDHGSGQPVLLVHGYPLNGRSWERQERALLGAGYRVITYDRRGFGQSAKPAAGYEYDTLAADLNVLIGHLDLRDVVLGGFSMGTGEVIRYLSTYGSARIAKAVLIGGLPPFLLQTADNPEGIDGQVFEDMKAAIVRDRFAYFGDFLDDFFNTDAFSPDRVGDRVWEAAFQVAAASSPVAAYACVDAWLTDFRADLRRIDVPTLAIHGTADRILPYEATAKRLPGLIKDLRLVTVEGGPHNIGWTHPDEVNRALLDFLAH
jgi:non-heme chloroperoxidase